MSETMIIVAQCRAISSDINRQCLRKAVADGLCVQHHRLKAFGIKLELAGDSPVEESAPLAPEIIPAAEIAPTAETALPSPEPTPAPRHRDFLDVSTPKPQRRRYVAGVDQPYHLPHGSPEQMQLLEDIRQIQEDAWYGAGYSREQIVAWFQGWPEKFGYPPYKWIVGPTPLNWKPRGGYLLSRS